MKTLFDRAAAPSFVMVLSLALIPVGLSAQNYGNPLYQWNGSAAGGQWEDAGNWTVKASESAEPAPAQNAPNNNVGVWLDDTGADRNITIDATFSGDRVRSFWMSQSSNTVNQLSIYKNFSFLNNIEIAASGSGTSKLFLSNEQLNGTTLTLNQANGNFGVTIGSGGVVELASVISNATNTGINFTAGITLDGGTLNLLQGVKSASNSQGTVVYNLSRGMTINSGTLSLGGASPYADRGYGFITDVRTNISGDFTMSGGRIENVDAGTKNVTLNGTNINITGGSIDENIIFTLASNNSQTLNSSVAVSSIGIQSGQSVVREVAVTAPGQNVGQLRFQQTSTNANVVQTLKMNSDLTLKSNYALPSAVGTTQVATTYAIDTNGHKLDLTSNASRWTPNRTAAGHVASWRLTGSGEIAARAFKFDSDEVAVTVGSGTTLRATGGSADGTNSNDISILSSNAGGTIAADSVFIYDGGAGKKGQLQSNRDIGQVVLESGTLLISGNSGFAAQGGVHVAAGSRLQLGLSNGAFTSEDWRFDISGNSYGSLEAATFTLDGSLLLNFDGAALAGTYVLLQTAGTNGLSGSFDSVTITGYYSLTLTKVGSEWSGVSTDGQAFVFSEGSGVLTVVPEASTTALLLSGAALWAGLWVRRRNRKSHA